MKTRNYTLFALGFAAAFTLGAGTLSAQARSTTRIPVTKDKPAEPMPPHVDTVRVVVHDTIMLPGKRDTIVRTVQGMMMHDTVMQMLPKMKLPGTYFTLGGGVAVPLNHWRDVMHDGYDLNAAVGYFPKNGALGIRIDGNYAGFAHRKTDCANCPDPSLLSGMADLVLRFPLDQYSHLNPVFYVLGGGGIDRFSNFIPYRNSDGRIVVGGANSDFTSTQAVALGCTTQACSGNRSYHFDYNVGAGMDITLWGVNLFSEARYVTINTLGGNSHYIPLIAGLKFY